MCLGWPFLKVHLWSNDWFTGCFRIGRIQTGSRWLQRWCGRCFKWPLVRGSWFSLLNSWQGQWQIITQLCLHAQRRLVVEVLWSRSEWTVFWHTTTWLCSSSTRHCLVQMEGKNNNVNNRNATETIITIVTILYCKLWKVVMSLVNSIIAFSLHFLAFRLLHSLFFSFIDDTWRKNMKTHKCGSLQRVQKLVIEHFMTEQK